MIHLLLKGMRYDDCTAQASTWPFIVSVKRQYLSLPQLLTVFPLCSARDTPPPLGYCRRIRVFMLVASVPMRRTSHPSGSRPRDASLCRQTSAPGIVGCPRKPSVPYRVQFCTAYRSHGSLTGPTLPGLTAEASRHAAMRRQAIYDGLRPGLIR